MNVRAGRCTGNGATKGNEGYARFTQVVRQRPAFTAIRMEADVHVGKIVLEVGE